MNGGKLIYKGSNVCVLTPEIPCKKTKKKSKNTHKRLSKIVFDKRKRKIDQEKKMNEKIKSIQNYHKWAIVFDHFCKSKTYSQIKEYDSEISDCVTKEKINQFNQYGQMYQGRLGGQTLASYIHDKYYWTINQKQFLKLMNMIEPLFHGLVKMKQNNIVHNDIKYANIVLDKNKFKYIDFGFSGFLNDRTFFEKRSKQEFDTFRFYDTYPIEYLYSFQTKKDLNRELTELEQFDFRRGFENINQFHSIYNRDIESFMKELIKKIMKGEKINKKKLIQSIDVYSLGIIIPLSFIKLTENNLLLLRNKCIEDFYKLFGKMTELNYSERLSAEKSFQKFKYLLKKYN